MARANRRPARRRRLHHSLHAHDPFAIRWTGDGKLSAAVLDLIEPFRCSGEGQQSVEALIGLGVAAWNVSLLPEEKRESMIARFAGAVKRPSLPRGRLVSGIWRRLAGESEEIAEFKQLMRDLVQRKLQCYANDDRVIAGHEVLHRGGGLSLIVASTFMPQAANGFEPATPRSPATV